MLVIIEGVDGSGKSVLIDRLKKQFKSIVLNYSYPKRESMGLSAAFAQGEYAASVRIFERLMETGYTVICDRFHLGEYAYGPVMRAYPHWLSDQAFNIENDMIWLLGPGQVRLVVLYCSDSNVAFERSAARKGEYVICQDDYRRINERYVQAATMTHLPVLTLATDRLNQEQVFSEVMAFIKGDRVVHL